MSRVAILTPDPVDASYAGLWPEVLARLQRSLDGAGIDTSPTPWTAHVDDAGLGAVGLRAAECVDLMALSCQVRAQGGTDEAGRAKDKY